MASIHGFNSWDEIADYIENTLGIHYTEDPTSWNDAMKAEMEGKKFVKIVNDATGQVTEEVWNESLYEGVGEFHVGENYQGQTVSGGGVKSAPTAKSVITENSSGGTAVITDEAIGTKDTGLVSLKSPINILSGLSQIYGLVHAGIKIANAQVWKDMSNYVYGTDFTEDTPLERVIDFMGMKITNCVTDHWHAATDDDALRVTIPESIARRMYEFLANHMIQTQTPGIDPAVEIYPLIYNFIHRTIELADPSKYTLERYESPFSLDPGASGIPVQFVEIGDDLFKEAVSDFITQAIGTGWLIASSVAAALIGSMNGVYQFLKDQSVDGVENADICSITVKFSRGSTPPPSDTPLSLSEFDVRILCYRDESIKYEHAVPGDPPTGVYTNCNISSTNITGYYPIPAAGYSYQNGDLTRYLKRGKTGEDPADYAYRVRPVLEGSSPYADELWSVHITYPANEQTFEYSHSAYHVGHPLDLGVNGYAGSSSYASTESADTLVSPLTGYMAERRYSNLGYVGTVSSYMPDDYLTAAGFRSKTDAAGNPEKHPNPDQTMEEAYPDMKKIQNARPQAQVDPETGQTIVTNNISNYVTAAVPSGSDNASRLIDHGLNNDDDPDSYRDDRSQKDKIEGRVNTEDPVDGYNEDTTDAVRKFDETRNDPYHYPEPIPANEPNPSYPTNPPVDPSGETDDPTDPTVLPGVTASGMVSVYNPTKAEVVSFSSWLWTGNVFENIKKLLQDPMEAIIGMHIMYATPHTTTPSNIIVGWLDSGVAAKVVDKQYTQLDCGSVFVPEYYGDVLDYEPYVHIHLYLPFIGIVSLKPNDVIGKLVNVTYGVDALTGTCLAMVTTTKGESKIQCYTFPGNCAVQIPLTGGNYANIIRGIASMAVGVAGSVLTGDAIGAVGGVIGGVMSSHLDVSHSGTLGANAGAMGVKKPYLIITRKVAYDAAGYNQFYGYPANKTVVLGACRGYTRVKSVHIESIPIATSDEKQQIEALLKQGVIIR